MSILVSRISIAVAIYEPSCIDVAAARATKRKTSGRYRKLVERLRAKNQRMLGEQIKESECVGNSTKTISKKEEEKDRPKYNTPKHFNPSDPHVAIDFDLFCFADAGNRPMSIWYGDDKWAEMGSNIPTKLGQDTKAGPSSRRRQQIQRMIVDYGREISAGNLAFVRNWTYLQIVETNWGSLRISALRTLGNEGAR